MTSAGQPEPPVPGRPSAAAAAAVRDWPRYFDAVGNAGPRETLVQAADRFDAERGRPIDPADTPLAIDFGCGTGRDTIELLKRGWRVLALDGEQEALNRLLRRPELQALRASDRLKCRLATFEDAVFPSCTLFNASYTLPFCPPGCFDGLWRKIVDAIEPGGRFAGQLFGEEDDWATLSDRTHHRREDLDALFRGFQIEWLKTDLYGPDPESAYPKRWHIYHIVARKR